MPTSTEDDDHRGEALGAEQVGQHGDDGPGGEEEKLEIAAPSPLPTASCASASIGPSAVRWSSRAARQHVASPCAAASASLMPAGPVDAGRARSRPCPDRAAGPCACGSGVDASSSSRCDRTETYSPAPMDSAPASSPAMTREEDDVVRHARSPRRRGSATRLLTRPSLAPNTAARNVPESRLRPRAASPRTTSPWMPLVGGHGGGRVRVGRRTASVPPPAARARARRRSRTAWPAARAAGCAGRPGARRPTWSPSSSSQCASWRPSASARPSRIARSSPVRRLGEVAVDGRLGALVGEVVPPAADLHRARPLGAGRRGHAAPSVGRTPGARGSDRAAHRPRDRGGVHLAEGLVRPSWVGHRARDEPACRCAATGPRGAGGTTPLRRPG